MVPGRRRAGLKVRIYAKERPPEVRSTFATGSWTPNSRYCTEERTTPELAAQWEEMTRISHRTYQHMLALPVRRYDAAMMAAELGEAFAPIAAWTQAHVTPWGSSQSFQWAAFSRR